MDIAPQLFSSVQAAEPGYLSPREETVVFALLHETREKAWPRFAPDTFANTNCGCHWLDPDAMKSGRWEQTLRELRPSVLVIGWGTPRIPDAITDDPDLPLRYVCHLAGTVREFLPRRLIERGVLVTNWGPSISFTVAEHALLLVLAALRGMPRWAPYMREWPSHTQPPPRRAMETRTLRGKRVGLHGFGAVARELVPMLRALGAEIAAYSHGVPAKVFAQHGVEHRETLESLFASSEVLVECEALSAVNTGSVDYRVLSRLPVGAVFVNIARGALVDEDALIRVARERSLRLGLDVFAKEPPPLDSALFGLADAVLSPHIAGPTEDAFPMMWDFAMKNLRAYLADGRGLEGVVTAEVYDRVT